MCLIKNDDLTYRECTSILRMHTLTGNTHSLYRLSVRYAELEPVKQSECCSPICNGSQFSTWTDVVAPLATASQIFRGTSVVII